MSKTPCGFVELELPKLSLIQVQKDLVFLF